MRLAYMLCLTVLAAGTLTARTASAQAVRYRSAVVDSAGMLRVTTVRGVEIRPEKVWDQVAFADAVVSPDSSAVAWSALFPNETTTYPITLMVGVLWNGHTRAFLGEGLMIARWAFEGGGKRIALERGAVHGASQRFFELYDVPTGQKVGHYDALSAKAPEPRWVRRLLAASNP